MGWKGNIRSFNATVKKIEKHQRQVEKQVHIQNCHAVVAKYETYMNEIVSFHKRCSSSIDWHEMKNKNEPVIPIREFKNQQFAKNAYKNYEPNFIIVKLNLVKWRKRHLAKKILKSRKKDKNIFSNLYDSYKGAHFEWKKDKERAERIYNKDISAYEEVVLSRDTFNSMGLIGTSVALSFTEGIMYAEIKVHNDEIIPAFILSLLKSGKISEKEMPKTQHHSLYQDYVCSVVLRIARELTTIFPLDMVVITAVDDLLNSSTGHLERQVILSVQIPKITLDKFNMAYINPSDTMKNFNHKMNFKNSMGFSPTDKIVLKGNSSAA